MLTLFSPVALPAQINNILSLIRTVSHWMFGLFLTGACLNFLMIFLVPLSVFTRWGTAPIVFFVFFGALCTTVATVIGTVLGVVMKNVITSQNTLDIEAYLGVQMFAFMWVAAATSIIAWLIMFGQCCCCASRRDVRRGKKRGSKKAWNDNESPGISEKRPMRQRRGLFGRKKDEDVWAYCVNVASESLFILCGTTYSPRKVTFWQNCRTKKDPNTVNVDRKSREGLDSKISLFVYSEE
ncbi:hypothetical protein KC326_g145 [Hortaea werneckii]|nr:hypothetical protein KC326_g145 [Hortaea werneckii]